jgi:hypothetical protein
MKCAFRVGDVEVGASVNGEEREEFNREEE